MDRSQTKFILRRMKRKSLSPWAWARYTPAKALPHELTFDLLDSNEKKIGVLAYTEINMGPRNFRKGTELTTPWGKARITFGESLTSGPDISLNDRHLASLKAYLLKKKFELVFPDHTMILTPTKWSKNDLEYFGDRGYLGVYEEKGVLPEGITTFRELNKDEIRTLPKDQRPRSIESRDFVQYRVKVSGDLPVKLDDVVAALMIYASFSCIMDETAQAV